ncbi:MAG TPA: hypothetical protein VGC81_00040 [Candidatus Methylomirabilis sp.]
MAFSIMRVFVTAFSLGLAALFGWIMWKLLSRPIRAEFIIR